MARIRRRKLKWEPSRSSQVIGYRLYWAVGGDVSYDSNSVFVGNVNEIILPDDIESFPLVQDTIEFGITAVNEIGNESDMAKLRASYEFSAPDPPSAVALDMAEGSASHKSLTEPNVASDTETDTIQVEKKDGLMRWRFL